MSVENNVPEIRFKGFEDEWNTLTLGDLGTVATNKRIFIHQTSLIGDVPFYKIGSFGREPKLFISQELFEDYKKRFPFPLKGDLLFSVIGSIGRVVEYTGEDAYFQDSNIVWLKHDGAIVNSFLKQFYLIVEWQGIEGSTIKHLYNRNILGTQIRMPPREEQTKIGNYFQNLDALINQHQQKHDKLSNIKKAMLEKMFPKQGETIPEIRFKGFSGEWEEKELGELAEIVRGASPRPIEDPKWFDKSSTVGWLRIRDVTEQDGRIYVLEQRISKLGQEKTRVLFEPHLLLSIAASVGKPVINYVETGVHDGFLIFKKPLFELEFMYQWLKSFQEAWQQYGQPGSQVNLNSDIVKGQVVCIPSNAEQVEIGNYFQKLDALINQHQQQISKLNNIKQACLSKMFV
jgi:type I restriction enzyme S subunit